MTPFSRCASALLLLALAALLSAPLYAAQEEKLLFDFDTDADVKAFAMRDSKNATLVEQHVTKGKKALKIPGGEQLALKPDTPMDWSGYDAVVLDVFVEGDSPVRVNLITRDKESQSNYWDWHNSWHFLQPGQNELSISVEGMFRGEAGANKSSLEGPVNSKQLIWFVLSFDAPKATSLYVDNMRLLKEAPPKGVVAFDFGPESQPLCPGFTPITWNTVHGKDGKTAGFRLPLHHANRGRDDTFPTRLYRDYVGFDSHNEFIVDVPNGKYHVWLVFDDCGYWNGEQAKHEKRSLNANGKEVWVENRGPDGPTEYLFKFENVEPKPGDSMWDLYMKDLFKPVRFEAEVTDGKLRIHCIAPVWLSTRVAAIVAFPDLIKAEGEKWLTELEARNKKEFEAQAIFLGPKPKTLDIPADAKAKGWWLGFPALEQDVLPVDAPGKAEPPAPRFGVPGQRLHFTFAIRPLKDIVGTVSLKCSDLKGPAGVIPASSLEPRYVHLTTTRWANEFAYRIAPHSMRRIDGSGLKLTKDLTRQFITTLSVPKDCKPGTYNGTATLTAGELSTTVPIAVEVVDVALDEPDFFFGFVGSFVPNELPAERRKNGWKDLGKLLLDTGSNTICGGPFVTFKGLDEKGAAILDFSTCDAFFQEMKELGYKRPMYSYGGPGGLRGLHDSYSIGKVGRDWEKKTGKSFNELLKIVWGAYLDHAKKNGWPEIYQYYIEEPGTVESATATLELAKAYRDSVPEVKFGGYYSVHWERTDPTSQKLQELAKTAYYSSLNVHSQADFDKLKEAGREMHIYNQGLSRYSFGAYQWAEMRKGAKGRLQWNTLALYAYQFFDLDGREPDSGVINWGKDEIIPSLRLARCCEGALDFRLAVTLWNLAEKKKGSPEATAAQQFLQDVDKSIPAGSRNPPAGFMTDDEFRAKCVEFLKKLAGR
ncbi:MAG TPA: hypothetical protein VEJ63_02860 [Planctomycetota bacterium]|nr:hypothetical protein [Planctomycetota bacterium]